MTIVNLGWPWWAAILVGVACGALIGLAIGVLCAKLGIPSFVVTLAAFLSCLDGLLRRALESSGRFTVDVATSPAAGKDMSGFRPNVSASLP